MFSSNRFQIKNSLPHTLVLAVEPEGAVATLNPDEEVEVVQQFDSVPLTLVTSLGLDGQLVVALWAGDGEMRVEKGGRDILDC